MAASEITPDTEDWTWVLERPCAGCGFDAAVVEPAAATAAGGYAQVSGTDWDRPGLRSNGSRFTVATLGRYHLHDVVHHLRDVAAG